MEISQDHNKKVLAVFQMFFLGLMMLENIAG
jgi:hypothetical protein